ncbi:hypothetical protein DsansV1_C26g0195841 [Dioscorea sansibarensis]
MRVHPLLPTVARGGAEQQNKLRRLPRIFSKMLELPLRRGADVAIEEETTNLRFTAATEKAWREVQAHAIEILPGFTKLVIRDAAGGDPDAGYDDLEFDRWRCRLPDSALPGLATARYENGKLIITVPK